MVGFPTLAPSAVFPALDATQTRWGSDLLMGNVLSFDVKVWDPSANAGQGAFVDLGFGIPPAVIPPAVPTVAWAATPQTAANLRPFGRPPVQLAYPAAGPNAPHPTQQLYSNAWVYDTWTRRIGGGGFGNPAGWSFYNPVAQQVPYPAPVQAIQIQIRLWDRKTHQTRQVTIIQDM
jgi:hypothetical protein